MELRPHLVALIAALLVMTSGCVTPTLFQRTGCDPNESLSGTVAMVLCNQTEDVFHVLIEYGHDSAYWERDMGNYSQEVHGEIVALEEFLEPGVRLIEPKTWDKGAYRGRITGTHATTGEGVTITIKFETGACGESRTGTDVYTFYARQGEDEAYGLRNAGACV